MEIATLRKDEVVLDLLVTVNVSLIDEVELVEVKKSKKVIRNGSLIFDDNFLLKDFVS